MAVRTRLRLVLLGLEALWLFVRVEVGLRRSQLPVLANELGLRLGTETTEAGELGHHPVPGWRIRHSPRVVTTIARRWPFGDTCLRRCLVLGALVRAANPTVVIGVRRLDGDIAAHSWLEFAGRSVDPMAGEYLPLSR